MARLTDFEMLLGSGADKVVVNTHAVREPEFITTAARRFGSQCVVVSVDYKRGLSGNRVMAANGTSNTARDPLEWAREVEQRGAGEIFLTSIDRDGTGRGYDIETLVFGYMVKLIAKFGGSPPFDFWIS